MITMGSSEPVDALLCGGFINEFDALINSGQDCGGLAPWICIVDFYCGPALWTCTVDLHCGLAPWTCTVDLHRGLALWTFTVDLQFALWICTVNFYTGLAPWYRIQHTNDSSSRISWHKSYGYEYKLYSVAICNFCCLDRFS